MKWEAKEIVHKGQNRIAIYFEKDAQAIKRIKLLPGARWSATLKAWHLPNVANYRKQFGLADNPTGKHALIKIHPANQGDFQKYLEALQLKAYSKSIIKTYCNEFAQFVLYLKDFEVRTCEPDRLRQYLLHCTNVPVALHQRSETIREHPAQPHQCLQILF